MRKEALRRQFGVDFDSGEDQTFGLRPELQIRFQLIIRFQFRFSTADDGLPKFRVGEGNGDYGHDRQFPLKKLETYETINIKFVNIEPQIHMTDYALFGFIYEIIMRYRDTIICIGFQGLIPLL